MPDRKFFITSTADEMEQVLDGLQERGLVGTPEWEMTENVRNDMARIEFLIRKFFFDLKTRTSEPLYRQLHQTEQDLQRMGVLAAEDKGKDGVVSFNAASEHEDRKRAA